MKKTMTTASQAALVSLFLVSCGGDPLEEAAAEACICLRPIYSEITAIKKALEQGDESVMEKKDAGLETGDQVEACLNGVQNDHPGVEEARLEKRLLELVEQGRCGKIE